MNPRSTAFVRTSDAREVKGAKATPVKKLDLLTNLALPDAMRLLGGRRRRLAAGGVIGLGIAIALLVIGGIGAFASAMLA